MTYHYAKGHYLPKFQLKVALFRGIPLLLLINVCLCIRALSERSDVPTPVGAPTIGSTAPRNTFTETAKTASNAGRNAGFNAGARVSRVPIDTARTITPIQIGDTIPEWLWHQPLQVINHPEGKDTITLNDYRGKLILLDFWGVWCVSCIAALPKFDRLQRQFPRDLVLLLSLRDPRESAVEAWHRNRITQPLRLPSIVVDTVLYRLFDHHTISHVAWISPSGRLCTTTGTDRVSASNLMHVLAGNTPDWFPKIDNQAIDYQAPFSAGADEEPSSGFRPHRSGAQQLGGISYDSSQHAYRRYLTNLPLYHYILMAEGLNVYRMAESQVHWRVRDRSRYVKPKAAYQSDWEVGNTYCYEAYLPARPEGALWRETLASHLRRDFPGLSFTLDTIEVACRLLVKTSDLEGIRASGTRQLIQIAEGEPVKLLGNVPVRTLVNILNRHFQEMPVLDGTAYTGRIDLTLQLDDLQDIPAVRRELNRHHLDLIHVTRRMPILTINDTQETFLTQ